MNLISNTLTGSIPTELGSLTNLEGLYLARNQLTGGIPTELGDLANLENLDLSINNLTGGIPTELEDLTNLQLLDLSFNNLTGGIPTELGNMTKLEILFLGANTALGGGIPIELGDLANLKALDMPFTNLEGSIPPELENLTNLESLNLNVNQLSGSIPSELGNLTNLQSLLLASNQLTGTIPAQLGDLANLRGLFMSDNRLTGSIPPELENLTNLRNLSLGDNQLTGSIPPELGDLAALEQFSLNDNQLSGSIPPELDNLVPPNGSLQSVYLKTGNPKLCGPIPPALHGFVPPKVNFRNDVGTAAFPDGEIPCPPVSYEQSSYTVAEGASVIVKVTLSADVERPVTIPITSTLQGGATAADFSGVPTNLTFNSAETEKSFTFTALDDTDNDDGESVKLAFGTLPAGVSAGANGEATVNITDDDVPAVTVSYEQSSYTVAEGDSVSVKVTLSADPERTVTIPIAKTNQGGATDADYSGVPVNVTFNSGDTEQSFTFTAVDDTVDDDDESVKLAFGTLPAGVTAGTTTEATVNITDDDGPAVTVSYEQASYTVAEGASVSVKVTLSADPERTVTVPIASTLQGGATAADFSVVPANLTFNSGDTEQSFTFMAAQDTDDDDDESVKLAFGTLPAGVTAGTTTEATVNITDDDDPTVTVSYEQSSYTAAEGGSVNVKVTLSADPERTVMIPIASTPQGGAIAADFSGVPVSVTFNSGETEQSFTFSATQDTDNDDGESVKLAFGTLPAGVNAGTTSEATVNITDDDVPAVTVSYEQSSYTVAEGGSVSIKVTLSADPERTVMIPIASTPQGGAIAADFSGVAATLTFTSGDTEESFTFNAAQDEEDDDDESVKLAFGTLPAGVSAGTTSEATVNITDDDVPTVTVSFEQSSYTVAEGGSVSVKVTLSADPERTVTIPIASTLQGGATAADYSGVPGNVTFNSGDTEDSFTFNAAQDEVDDDDESVKLAFGTLPAGVTAGTPTEATVNITDDDVPAVTVSYEQSSYTVSEDSSVTVKVILSADPERTVTVPVAKTNQDGASDADYSGVPVNVTFNSGETENSFTFMAVDDTNDDDGESVKLAFGTLPAGVSAGTTSEATVNITDDDVPTVTVSYEQSSYTVAEGGSVNVKVTLSADPERTVTIPIESTLQGGAIAADFSGVPAGLTFNSGETENSFTFTAVDDTDDDDGESVQLAFGALPTGVTAGTTTEATVSITDDDLPVVAVSYEQSSYTVSEDSSVTVKVILSADPERTVTIPIESTLQGGAIAADFSGVPAGLTFNSGDTEESFTFNAAQDEDDDDGESVQLAFGTLPAGVNAGANSEATVNITDDDVPTVTVSFEQSSYTVAEGGSVSVKVTLSADPERTVTIPIASTLQGGATAADFSGVPAGLTFTSGDTEESFTFSAAQDEDNDDDESVKLAFGTLPAGVNAGATSEATVDITDDDLPTVAVSFEQASYT
ncbi:MAG: hypothetical protein OXI80_07845, partial [Caldilineaceae bacterium]|nr:hypothetical protein [Caldilineaceae bacterium]